MVLTLSTWSIATTNLLSVLSRTASSTSGMFLYGTPQLHHAHMFIGSAAGSDTLLLTPPSSPVSLVQYRSIGGTFNFYFFSGPSPQKVIEQYSELIGAPTWQPVWAFGFHICRWGYSSLEATKEVVQKMREANIPLEGRCLS